MKIEKPDGKIEIRNSSCGCCPPPGHQKEKMHTNNGSTWWRIDNKRWHRIEKSNLFDVYDYAQAADSCAEFKQVMQDL